jgi:L,D-transpeptidase YcbB
MMRVLCVALLVPALAGFAMPAFARIDDGFSEAITTPSPRAVAVRAVLDEASDTGDPIEKIVLGGVRDFYAARNDDLLWVGHLDAPQQATTLRTAMDKAADYGLDPHAYATPKLAEHYPDDPRRLAEADVEFSLAVARLVTHIASGRVDPAAISHLITLEPERPDIAEALTRLSQSVNVAADLASYEPQHPQYVALKAQLAKLRASATEEEERIVVPDGGLMRPGKRDDRAPILRARLDVTLAPDADPEIYDQTLVEAVRTFQTESGLNADGVVGPQTLGVMNGRSREEEIAAVIANLERWRWMPRELGDFYVMVNVPEFVVRVVKDDATVHETRVVVGKPTNPTPTFSNMMSYLIVNPYWNVPASIISKEMLPEIRNDPYGYFARQGYEVFVRVGGRMRQVDPRWIDWYSINPRSVQIRQIPGDFNALGRIKFMFPNQHSVYLHDTPAKSLFKRDQRAFSHGCVRVEDPLDFADALLVVAAPEWNSKRLEKLFGGPERRVNLDTPVPVHLAYFTEWVAPDGELHHFEDIYGYDGEISAYLGS